MEGLLKCFIFLNLLFKKVENHAMTVLVKTMQGGQPTWSNVTILFLQQYESLSSDGKIHLSAPRERSTKIATTYNKRPRGGPRRARKPASVRFLNCSRPGQFALYYHEPVKWSGAIRKNRFILKSEETTSKIVRKKALYTSTQLTRVNKMRLGDIYSDREVRAIMVDSGASEHEVNRVKLFKILTPIP